MGEILAWNPVVRIGGWQRSQIARVMFSLGEGGHVHPQIKTESLKDIDLGARGQSSPASLDPGPTDSLVLAGVAVPLPPCGNSRIWFLQELEADGMEVRKYLT